MASESHLVWTQAVQRSGSLCGYLNISSEMYEVAKNNVDDVRTREMVESMHSIPPFATPALAGGRMSLDEYEEHVTDEVLRTGGLEE